MSQQEQSSQASEEFKAAANLQSALLSQSPQTSSDPVVSVPVVSVSSAEQSDQQLSASSVGLQPQDKHAQVFSPVSNSTSSLLQPQSPALQIAAPDNSSDAQSKSATEAPANDPENAFALPDNAAELLGP